MKSSLWIITFLILFAAVYNITANVALAQIFPDSPPLTIDRIKEVIFSVADFFIVASGFLMVIFIIWAGIMWMQAGANETRAGNAKKRLWQGVVGSLIIFGVGVILETGVKVVSLEFFGIEPGDSSQSPGELGDPCQVTVTGQDTCGANLICVNGKCKGDIGYACLVSGDCAALMICDRPIGGTPRGCRGIDGFQCQSQFDCATGYNCTSPAGDPDKKCRKVP